MGHPVAGLLPILLLSTGWVLLAMQVVPWIRDLYAQLRAAGEQPLPSALLAMPPSMLLVALIAGGLLLIGLATALVWIRSAGGMGPLSDRLLRRNEILAGIVLLASGVLTSALIARGDPVLGEARNHVARGWLWYDNLRAGVFPRWSDLWCGGSAVDQLAPPLTHLLQALIGFLRFDSFEAAKHLAWFSRIAGGVGFALFCARIHRDHRAGLLGGILYALAPTSHAAWIWDGRLPGAVALGILPWALLAAERIATGAGAVRSGALLALLGGGLVLVDLGQARFAVLLIGWLLVLRGVTAVATRGARSPSISGILVGLIGGAALAAGFLYPMAREASFLNGPAAIDLPGFGIRVPALAGAAGLLHWNTGGKDYVGLSIVVLAIVGLLRSLLDRKEEGRGIGPIPLALLIVLPWLLSSNWWHGRDMAFIGVQAAAAASVRRGARPARHPVFRKGILPLAFLLVLIDLAPISLMTTYEARRGARDQVYARLADRLGSGRFLELPTDGAGKVVTSLSGYAPMTPTPSIGGPSIRSVPRSFAHTAAMVDTVARALSRGGSMNPGLIDLLALHNVRYVVASTSRGQTLLRGVEADRFVPDPDVPGLRVEGATPVMILEPGVDPGPTTPSAAIGRDGLAPDVSRDLARESLAWLRRARPKPVIEARSVALPNRLEIELPDLGPVTIRIARNSYPRTEVLLDDQAWPWRDGPLGGTVIDLPRGAHRIVIRAVEDRIRRVCRYAQWGLAAILFLIAISPHRH